MKSQQLFEIDRQIGQIKKAIQQRQEKTAEWNVPLDRILKPTRKTDYYLSKKYPDAHIEHYQTLAQEGQAQAKEMLQKHLTQSRIKIRRHRNQLKELDLLQRKRNMVRLLKLREQKNKENSKQIASISKAPTPPKKDPRSVHEFTEKNLPRSQKQQSMLGNLKRQKLLQILQEGRSAGGTISQEAAALLKRQLCVGIEHTPFYSWMQRRNRQEKRMLRQRSNAKLKIEERTHSFPFFKTIKEDIQQRKQIYLRKKKNIAEGTFAQILDFQQRLLRVMRYHQQSVDSLTS